MSGGSILLTCGTSVKIVGLAEYSRMKTKIYLGQCGCQVILFIKMAGILYLFASYAISYLFLLCY